VTDTIERRFLMTGPESDFHRLLPLAFPGISYDAALRRFSPADGAWSLTLGHPRPLGLAAVKLMAIEVVLRATASEIDAVAERFLRYFQRGGG